MKNKFQVLNGFALIATIAINYISNIGVLNGETMGSVSAKYQTLFTPAGYAFSIWGLIYIGLMGFVIYYGPFTKSSIAKQKVISDIGWWFVISCLGNSLWVVAWLYDYTFLSLVLMVTIFVSLLRIVQLIKPSLRAPNLKTTMFLRLPFHIYAGWISVALIANASVLLKKIQWNGFGILETAWTVVMIIIAMLVHLYMLWKQKMPAFALVAVWALLAIAVANQHANSTIYYISLAVALFLFGNIAVYFFRKNKLNEKQNFCLLVS